MKKFVCLMLAAVLLAGCTGATTPAQTTTKPTVPDKTPMEMLGQTVKKTLGASSFALEFALKEGKEEYTTQFSVMVAKDTRGGYVALTEIACGCAEYVSGKTYVSFFCESGEGVADTAEDYLDMPYLLRLLPTLDQGVLERFCNTGLTATPTANGGMRFEISGLDERQMEQLLGEELEVSEGFVGFFAMEMDAGGNLTEVEFTRGQLFNRIRLTKINQKLDIPKPDWA